MRERRVQRDWVDLGSLDDCLAARALCDTSLLLRICKITQARNDHTKTVERAMHCWKTAKRVQAQAGRRDGTVATEAVPLAVGKQWTA